MSSIPTARNAALAFPIGVVRFAIMAMLLLLSVATYLTVMVGNNSRDLMKSQMEVLTATERLQYYGNMLEHSIRTAVRYGDWSAAAQYRKFQPELRQTLKELQTDLQLREDQLAAERVSRADLGLVAMEHEALQLAIDGDFRAARKIVSRPRYAELLAVYDDGIGEIERRAEAYVKATDEKLDLYTYADLALTLTAFGLIAIGWLALVQPARRWGSQLSQAREIAERAAEQLKESRAELEALNSKLFEQARVDHLTKLYTRLKFYEDVEQLWPRVERHGDAYCAAMCDIDNFKQYNDTYGHLAGDEVLKQVADALSSACRRGDQIYRFGGEEFVIVMPHRAKDRGNNSAERFRAAVEALKIAHSGSASAHVTISIGFAWLTVTAGNTVECWLSKADAALYEAKRSGRNCVVGNQPAVAAAA